MFGNLQPSPLQGCGGVEESSANGDAPVIEVVVLGGRGPGRGGGGAKICLADFSQGDSGDAESASTPTARRGSTSPISPCSLASPKVVQIISTPPHATSPPTDSSSSYAAPSNKCSSAAAAVDSPVASAIGDGRLGIAGNVSWYECMMHRLRVSLNLKTPVEGDAPTKALAASAEPVSSDLCSVWNVLLNERSLLYIEFGLLNERSLLYM